MSKIRTFQDLYDFFKKHNNRYSMTRIIVCENEALEVCLLGDTGKPMHVVKLHPEMHTQLASYIFEGVEVKNPKASIPELTCKALVIMLGLSPQIFEYPPNMSK